MDGEPHGQHLQPAGGGQPYQEGSWGQSPGRRLGSSLLLATHVPQGNFKFEHLPDDPDVAEEAGAVDTSVGVP